VLIPSANWLNSDIVLRKTEVGNVKLDEMSIVPPQGCQLSKHNLLPSYILGHMSW
jgi:hypothetical protein